MKLVRKIDENGCFIEDVLIKKTDNGDYVVPDDCIDEDIPAKLIKAKWDGKNWVESANDDELLFYLKAQKKDELIKEKQRYIERPITINNKTFFASLDAYTKYKAAYDLGVKKGLTEGEVILSVNDKPKWQTVTKEEMEQYFEAFELQGWNGERKLGYYLDTLENASTKEEVEAIVWEDERGV